MAKRKSTLVWRKWHRWIGLLVALPVLVLSASGLLLNHLDQLSWSSQPVPPLVARWYGATVPSEILGDKVAGRWYAQANDRLYIDQAPAAYCGGRFRGVVAHNGVIVAGCGRELLLLDQQGQELERLGAAYGVPAFSRLGASDGRLVLESNNKAVLFDVEQLGVTPLPQDSAWQPATLRRLPEAAAERIKASSVPASLTWERFLLDVHAGRILGLTGQLIMDLSALVLMVLAATGLVIWWRTRG